MRVCRPRIEWGGLVCAGGVEWVVGWGGVGVGSCSRFDADVDDRAGKPPHPCRHPVALDGSNEALRRRDGTLVGGPPFGLRPQHYKTKTVLQSTIPQRYINAYAGKGGSWGGH